MARDTRSWRGCGSSRASGSVMCGTARASAGAEALSLGPGRVQVRRLFLLCQGECRCGGLFAVPGPIRGSRPHKVRLAPVGVGVHG